MTDTRVAITGLIRREGSDVASTGHLLAARSGVAPI
jgi:hypothetical protein